MRSFEKQKSINETKKIKVFWQEICVKSINQMPINDCREATWVVF
jgi:hypothetical protein